MPQAQRTGIAPGSPEAAELGRRLAELGSGLRDVSELYNDYAQVWRVAGWWGGTVAVAVTGWVAGRGAVRSRWGWQAGGTRAGVGMGMRDKSSRAQGAEGEKDGRVHGQGQFQARSHHDPFSSSCTAFHFCVYLCLICSQPARMWDVCLALIDFAGGAVEAGLVRQLWDHALLAAAEAPSTLGLNGGWGLDREVLSWRGAAQCQARGLGP